MDAESIITLILGTGFVTSFITLVGTHFLNKKQKDSERKIRIKDKIIAELYSPLYLDILQITSNLGTTGGLFLGFLNTKDAPLEKGQQVLIDGLKKLNYSLCSKSIRELLSSNIGFVRPEEFRTELSFFFALLEDYEKQVELFVNEGFKQDIETEKKWLVNMIDASFDLSKLSTMFLVNINRIMDSGISQTEPLVFKITLSSETFTNLHRKILSRYPLKIENIQKRSEAQENKSA